MKINPKIFLLTVRDSLDPSDPKLGSYIPPSFVFDCVCVYYILSCVPPIINNKSEKITGYLKSILVILSTPFLSLDKCWGLVFGDYLLFYVWNYNYGLKLPITRSILSIYWKKLIQKVKQMNTYQLLKKSYILDEMGLQYTKKFNHVTFALY